MPIWVAFHLNFSNRNELYERPSSFPSPLPRGKSQLGPENRSSLQRQWQLQLLLPHRHRAKFTCSGMKACLLMTPAMASSTPEKTLVSWTCWRNIQRTQTESGTWSPSSKKDPSLLSSLGTLEDLLFFLNCSLSTAQVTYFN